MKILVINGPNINMLGIREPEVYGNRTYEDLKTAIREQCPDCDIMQSNHEGDLIDAVQNALGNYDGIAINPGGYTHTSIALADALRAVRIPAVEVHLTDLSAREDYRKVSYISEVCVKTFMGHGFDSYREGIDFLMNYLDYET